MSRIELIELCNKAVVPHKLWRNRDTSSAQRQVGELLALLRADCPFEVVTEGDWATSERTIVVKVSYRGFSSFEEDAGLSKETFYLPTQTSLDEAAGRDWY